MLKLGEGHFKHFTKKPANPEASSHTTVAGCLIKVRSFYLHVFCDVVIQAEFGNPFLHQFQHSDILHQLGSPNLRTVC